VTAGKGSLDKIMGDIFISYAHEDRPAAERVAAALKRHGWAVWWDPDIAPGDVWDELIERKLAAASCVVVLWSGTSVHKQWVKAEASEAQARGILVPVLIEDVKPPLAFCQIQAAHLADWRGEREHCGFQQLLCTVCGLLESQTTPVLRGPRQSWREPPFADDRAAGDMIYGAPAARPAEPSRAPAAMPTGLPLVPMLPNAGTLTPQSPKRRSNAKKDAAKIVALVLLGAVIGYALHEPLNVLLGGL
jgi:TIR domain-containing protein